MNNSIPLNIVSQVKTLVDKKIALEEVLKSIEKEQILFKEKIARLKNAYQQARVGAEKQNYMQKKYHLLEDFKQKMQQLIAKAETIS